MNTEIELKEITYLENRKKLDEFYNSLEKSDAEYLQLKEYRLAKIVGNAKTEMGKELKEAQDRLASFDKTKGTFRKWIELLDISHNTVYNLINRYDYLVINNDKINLIESLPTSLSYAISSPSAPKELVGKVLNGDITTHKEYIEQKKQLQELQNNIDTLQFQLQIERNKEPQVIEKIIEKEIIPDNIQNELQEKQKQIREMEIQIKNAEDRIRIQNLNYSELYKKNEELEKLKEKEKEITKMHNDLENLKRMKSDTIKRMEDETKIFKSIERVKEIIKDELLYIPTLTVHYTETEIMKKEITNLVELLENLKIAFINKFNII